jgi:hypothetical protein
LSATLAGRRGAGKAAQEAISTTPITASARERTPAFLRSVSLELDRRGVRWTLASGGGYARFEHALLAIEEAKLGWP